MARERRIVRVDASYYDGYAGFGMTGAFGEHSVVRDSIANSVTAEIEAIHWAMEIVRESEDANYVKFATDCDGAASVFMAAEPRDDYDWIVRWVPRKRNREANWYARRALRTLVLTLDDEFAREHVCAQGVNSAAWGLVGAEK